ncbi:MAG TPA: SDR family oxidoreductase [Thermodesulfobacteriota bacterium]|nr:SDR family oxidoreductase [Thermodesulfobacteriota bacterium]
METISILGCGWLGLSLAEFLLGKGYKVKGSTTARSGLDEMKSRRIEPFYLVIDPGLRGEGLADFFDCDVLVVNFPPERRDDIAEYHPAQIRSLIAGLAGSRVKKVLFVSSTSVYPDLDREVTEDESAQPSKQSGIALLRAERLLRDSGSFVTTIVRFGGLIGYDRMPGRFLAGKKGIGGGDAPVNLIHRDDCVGIIYCIISQNLWGETLNACADEHPLRKDYYTARALALGLEPPEFKEGGKGGYKIVNSGRLKKLLGYRFKYPNPSRIED